MEYTVKSTVFTITTSEPLYEHIRHIVDYNWKISQSTKSDDEDGFDNDEQTDDDTDNKEDNSEKDMITKLSTRLNIKDPPCSVTVHITSACDPILVVSNTNVYFDSLMAEKLCRFIFSYMILKLEGDQYPPAKESKYKDIKIVAIKKCNQMIKFSLGHNVNLKLACTDLAKRGDDVLFDPKKFAFLRHKNHYGVSVVLIFSRGHVLILDKAIQKDEIVNVIGRVAEDYGKYV